MNSNILTRLRDFNEANIIVLLIALTILFSLSYDFLSKYTLYAAFYISLIFIFIRKDGIKSKEKIFPFIIIIFGIFEISWAKYFHSIQYDNIHSHYYNSGKRIVMCALILFHFFSVKERVNIRTLNICRYILMVSCIYLSGYGLYEYLSFGGRIGFGMYATTGSYIYSVQALLTLYVISIWKMKYRNLLLVLFSIITILSIILSGTRVVMLIYPLCVIFLWLKKINFKILISFSIFIFIGLTTKIIPLDLVTSRINNTFNEISAYQKNDVSSSLGARFSLWKAGIYIIGEHPYGLSADQRNQLAKNYINEKQYGNSAALDSVEYHLHNDIINIGSLQGLIGIILLLSLYISMVYFSYIFTHDILLTIFISVPTIVFGFSDTLFISSKYVYVAMSALILYFCYSYKKNSIEN
ncbi:O-antigen ligase [Pragia fontium]|uniref:O-antigen ligase family protein n=1 Tax=Pragia fontium TaxID=82985 RepID=UPI000DFD72C5|nr:O-antigen ligase family protein [Pragia fontium]SUB84036.1 O-antigen ligase [Pragia fontium]